MKKRTQIILGLVFIIVVSAFFYLLNLGRVPTTIADIVSWTFDDPADYTLSGSEIAVSSGVASLTTDFFDADWDYRQEITISNPNTSPLTEYQVEVSIDGTNTDFWSHVASDCSDVRFTDDDKTTELDFYRFECDSGTSMKAFVQIPSLAASSTKEIYMYYGNASASDASDIVSTFEYASEQVVGYIGTDLQAAQDLNVVSLEDGNNISNGTSTLSLDEQDTGSFANAELSIGTEISAKKLFHATGDGDGTDMINPAGWAGTEFTVYRDRDTKFLVLFSPFGTASVDVKDNGSTVAGWGPGAVTGTGSVIALTPLGLADNDILTIESDIPIYASIYVTSGPSPGDTMPLYPSTEEDLYGASHSNYIQIATGDEAGTVSWEMDNGEVGSTPLGTYSGYEDSTFTETSDSQGWGPAVKVESDTPISVIQMADADGREVVGYLPYRELGTKFGANYPVQNILVAAPEVSTTCTVTNDSGAAPVNPASGFSNPHLGGVNTEVNKIFFGYPVGPGSASSDSTKWLDGGWKMECDKPVYAYFEKEEGAGSEPSDETHLSTYPQMRQFVYPTPVVTTFAAEEKTFSESKPTVVNDTATAFTSLNDFAEMLGSGNEGSVRYHISPNGSDWYYHDGVSWIAAAGFATSNTAAEVDADIATFHTDVSSGDFYFKAFLDSDGTEAVELDKVEIDFISDNITVTNPTTSSELFIGDALSIEWDYSGAVGTEVDIFVDSGDGNGFDLQIADDESIGMGGSGSFSWNAIPESEQGDAARIRICSVANPLVCDNSDTFKILPSLTITSPNGGEELGALSSQTISWTTAGTVGTVTVSYSVNSGVSWTPISGCISAVNTGSCNWTVINSDDVTTAKVRVEQSDDSDIFDESDIDFSVDYYDVTWNIQDSETLNQLNNLSVSDTSGVALFGKKSPVVISYPYGTYSTTWSKSNYKDVTDSNWTFPDQNVLTLSRDVKLSLFEGLLEQFRAFTNARFDAEKNELIIDSWLEGNGEIVSPLTDPEFIHEIYDESNNLIQTLQTASVNSVGVSTLTWENTTLVRNELYFIKTRIKNGGEEYSSGTTYEITIPDNLSETEKSLTTISNELDNLKVQQSTDANKINSLVTDIELLLEQNNQIQANINELLSRTPQTATATEAANTLTEARELVGLLEELQNASGNRLITRVFYTDGSVIANVLIANPSNTETRSSEISIPLPREVNPEIVVNSSGFDVAFDPAEEMYFLKGVVALEPGQVITKKATFKDIWNIESDVYEQLRQDTFALVRDIETTPFITEAIFVEGNINNSIDKIRISQSEEGLAPDARIALFRENSRELQYAEDRFRSLQNLSIKAEDYRRQRITIILIFFIFLPQFILTMFFFWKIMNLVRNRDKPQSAKEEKEPQKKKKTTKKKSKPRKKATKKTTAKKSKK